MANINALMSNTNININFFNIHQYIPDIHISRDISDPILDFPGYRFIKSHSSNNPFYGHVIYITRDPRDVMLSYYHYLTQLGYFYGSVSDLISSKRYGIANWVAHVDGWFNKSDASIAFIHVRYEDLKVNTEEVMVEIYNKLGLIIPRDIIAKAIEYSSFKSMSDLERAYGYGGRDIANQFIFMRKGVSGEGRLGMSPEELAYIEECAGPRMNSLGYF
jgi:hypothetical protein